MSNKHNFQSNQPSQPQPSAQSPDNKKWQQYNIQQTQFPTKLATQTRPSAKIHIFTKAPSPVNQNARKHSFQ